MGFNVVYSAPPFLQAGLAGLGGYLQARRDAEAQENRAEAIVRSNEQAAIGQGLGQLGRAGIGGYFANQGNDLGAIYALAGPAAAGGYIANTSLAEQAQANRLALQDDAQAFSAEQAPIRAQERLDYLRNATAYRLGASPDYLQQIGQQAGAQTPDQAFALGYQRRRDQQAQAEIDRNVNYFRQAQGAEQELASQVDYEYSPQTKQRFAQLTQAQQQLFSDPQFTYSPGVLNPPGIEAYRQTMAEIGQLRPTPRIRGKQPPPLAAQLGGEAAGWSGPSPMYAQRNLPDGSIEIAYHDGKKLNHRIHQIKPENQSVVLPRMREDGNKYQVGDEVDINGRKGNITLKGDIDWQDGGTGSRSSRSSRRGSGGPVDPFVDAPFADLTDKEFLDAISKIPDEYTGPDGKPKTRSIYDKIEVLRAVQKYRTGEVGELGLPPSQQAVEESQRMLREYEAEFFGIKPENMVMMLDTFAVENLADVAFHLQRSGRMNIYDMPLEVQTAVSAKYGPKRQSDQPDKPEKPTVRFGPVIERKLNSGLRVRVKQNLATGEWVKVE